MTQMLLFDAPANTNVAPNITPLTVAETNKAALAVPVNASARQPLAHEHKSGLNHMGELARLVLLRYELAAKRRAERAERAAKTNQ